MTYLQLFFPGLMVLCAATMLWNARTQGLRGRRFLWTVFGTLVLFCWPPIAWFMSGTLEWQYAASPPIDQEAEAIVVLGGGAHRTDGDSPVTIPAQDTLLRCRYAAWLRSRFPNLPLMVYGGGGVAQSMQELLAEQGVPRSRITLESDSSSTYENALYAAKMLEQRGIQRVFLVTEAHHMLRAERVFEQLDIDVVPAPCGFRAAKLDLRPGWFLPGATAIKHNEEALHEWLGLAWYWIRGRI